MNLKEAVSILKTHNEWRRGGDGEPTDPFMLGEAIDKIVTYDENILTFTVGTEKSGKSSMFINFPRVQWKKWKEYCNKQEFVNGKLYGWDFAENEYFAEISPDHIKDFYSFLVGGTPSEGFHNLHSNNK